MGGGFKWKDKTNKDRGDDERDRRSGRNDSYRPNRYNDDRNNRGRDHHQDRDKERENFRAGDEAKRSEHRSRKDKDGKQTKSSDSKPPSRQQPSAPPPRSNAAAPTFITVFVNDRLGTKAQIPCLPSDTIGDFKKIVAASIGRKPHEIMLKRQGERPMKDAITLADYEISNGVQLDLELDTGDG